MGGLYRVLETSRAPRSSLPGSAVNDATTTTSDMRSSSREGDAHPTHRFEDAMSLRINHVSINALDLQESVDFYVDLLGAEPVRTPNFGIPVQWLPPRRTPPPPFERRPP